MQPISLDTEQRKKRITFWTIACIIVHVVYAISFSFYTMLDLGINIGASEMPPGHAESAQLVIGLLFLLFTFPLMIVHACIYFFFIFRLWEEIPRNLARTTPEMAAWLSLIPIFQLYWMFIALVGLYQDMNKATESSKGGARFGTTLITTACVVWLVSFFFFFILGMAQGVFASVVGVTIFLGIVGFITALIWYLFTMAMLWIIRRDVCKFIDIKSSIERTCDFSQEPRYSQEPQV